MFCDFCGKSIVSKTKSRAGLLVYLSSGACLSFCCLFGCFLLPFCQEPLKDVVHFCPTCHNTLGVHARI